MQTEISKAVECRSMTDGEYKGGIVCWGKDLAWYVSDYDGW